MAAASDRFSIRDYAAKMRIVDLAKSWPFIGEKDEKPTLPPISIRRFRWWTDELSSERYAADATEIKAEEAEKTNENPDEKIELHSPNPPPTATTEKTTEEEYLRSLKAKTRMPKKRSIVELFASAPQIETVDQSNGNDGDGENKEEAEKVMKRKRKGKRRKGTMKMEIRSLKKEKVCQPRKISRHSILLQDLINPKALPKTPKGVVESKKFVKVKILKNKHLLQTPNQTSMNQKVVKKLPIHSILKNKNRFSPARKTCKIKKANTVELIKRCCKPARHVTFSDKDDILGHGNNCSSINLPQFKSLCKIFSDVFTKSSVMNNSRKVQDLPSDSLGNVNAIEEDIYREDESSSQKNQLGNVNSSNSSCSSTEKASMAIMIDLNRGIETSNDTDCFNPTAENLLPRCTNSGDLAFKGSSTSTEFQGIKHFNFDFASDHGFYAQNQVVHNITANPLKVMKEKIIDAASYKNDQLDWCKNQYDPTRERIFTEFIGPERVCIQNNEPVKGNYEFLHSHANKTKLYFHDEKTCDATPDFFKAADLQQKCNLACHFEPVVKPTIRLMGQNVVVGSGNRDWYSSLLPEKCISKERTLPEFIANTSNFCQTTERMKPKFGAHIGDHGSESLPHKAFLNKTDKIVENCITGEEISRHQYYPTIACYQHNIQQNRLLSSFRSNHCQGVSSGAFVTPQPQVRYNFHENSFQTAEESPQWLIQAMHQKRNKQFSSPYSDQTELSQPCRLSETNLIPRLSPYNMPMVPFAVHNISPSKNSAFVQNSSQSSFISAVTATNSISEGTKSTAINNKERDESYSNFTGFNTPVHAHKSRKRTAASDNVFMRSAWRPYF